MHVQSFELERIGGRRLAALLTILVLLAGVAAAQVATGVIRCQVVDASGALVPNAKVEVVSLGTNQKWERNSSSDGETSFVELPPGEYSIQVNSTGFAEWKGTLTLRVTQLATVVATLSPATTTTVVEVADVTPVITTQASSLSDVKEFNRITTLPLANRNFLSILNFTPGVVSAGFAGQGSGYTRINGLRGGSVEYLVDGMSATERYTNELQRTPQPIDSIQEIKISTTNATAEYSRPGTVEVATKSGTNQFHGNLFEMHQNSKFKAKDFHTSSVNHLVRNEFGGNLGGPVWIPKIYDGRNKTFFFIDGEGIVQRSAGVYRVVVPKANWKKGDFSDYTEDAGNLITVYDPLTTRQLPSGAYARDPFAGNRLPSARLNGPATKVLSYVPDPNVNTPYWEGPNWERPNAGAMDDKNFYTVKGDQIMGAHRLSVRYSYTNRNRLGPRYFLNDNVGIEGGHNAAVSLTSMIRPTVVNEARVGIQRFRSYRGPILLDPPITETVGLPTYPGTVAWPGVYFGDCWTSGCTGYFEGIDRDNPQDAPMLGYQFADNLNWNKGRHELKFGFLLATNAVNTYETGQPGGDYNFSGLFTALQDPAAVAAGSTDVQKVNTGAALGDMLLGHVDGSWLNQYPRFYTRQKQFSGYAQDNWRASRNFTLTLGIRYEYWTPMSDKRDSASTLYFTGNTAQVVYPGAPPITKQGFPQNVVDAFTKAGLVFKSAQEVGYPDKLWSMPKNNWAPRVGFAYQLANKTVFRGAYGIYYWVMPLVQYHQNTRKNAPYSYSFESLTDPNDNLTAELVFPKGGSEFQNQSPGARDFGKKFINPDALSISKGSGWRILPWDTQFKTQMAQTWNATLEHELPWRLGSRVSYIGTQGSNLEVYDPINFTLPRKLAPGLTPAQRRAYPDFATSDTNAMDLLTWAGYSNSHQMQLELKRNFSNGLVFQTFYTYQRALTTSEGSNNSYGGLEVPPGALTNGAPLSKRLDMIYANDSYLPRYSFSINGTYPLPFGKGRPFVSGASKLVEALVGGWNIGAFYYWRSGLFFAPYFNVRGSNTVLAGQNSSPILPKEQRQAARWFDPRVWRADLGAAYNGEPWARRADTLDNDFLNNVPRNFMTGPGFYNIDFSVVKYVPVTEQVKLRLDLQTFNLLNHKNFGLPGANGVINSGVGGPRLLQFQARVEF